MKSKTTLKYRQKNDAEEVDPFVGKTILLVNTGWAKKKFIFQKLKRLGLTIVVVHKEKNWAEPYVDHWIIADTTNHSETLLAVKSFIRNHPRVHIDGAITFWEDDVLITSKIVDRFNFIGVPYSIAKHVRNKFLFREFCRENGLPAPKHRLVKSEADVRAVREEFTFPVVIKPVYGASSNFVVKVEKKEDLPQLFEYVQNNISIDILSSLADGLDLLIEEYIDGDEVDVDAIVQNGKVKFSSISDNFDKTKDIFFIDRGQSVPSGLPPATQEAMMMMVEEVLEKLGIQNGIIHFEAKATKHGPVPIEVNVRMGGDYVYSYIKDALDVDLIEYAVRIAIGDYIKPFTIEKPKKYVIGWDLHPEFSGMLVELDIDEELKDKPYVEEIHIDKQIGDSVLVPPEGYDNLGWITVSGDNMLDAQDNLRSALNLMRFNVVPFDKESVLGQTLRESRSSTAVLSGNAATLATKVGKLRVLPSASQRRLRIGILSNRHANGKKIEGSAYDIGEALKRRGYEVTHYNANAIARAFEMLQYSDTDIMFNLTDTIHNTKRLSFTPAAVLDALQIPYIGSDAFVRALCLDKILAKKLLTFHKIPMPRWDYMNKVDDPLEELEFPLIVKPSLPLDTGENIDTIIKNQAQLEAEIPRLLAWSGGPIILEEFITAQEYDVFILGNTKDNFRVLPIVKANGQKGGRRKRTQNIGTKLQTVITEIALDTYNRLDCADYGQVKIRIDEDANPFVIGVDPNPRLGITSQFASVAKIAGISYEDLVEQIIHLAIERYKEAKLYQFPT